MNLIKLYECKIGSHAYGLATPESDLDIRGVVMPDDLRYYFGMKTFEQKVFPEPEDKVYWHVRKFCHLAAAGNTQMLEMLFSPEDCVLFDGNEQFKYYILLHKETFITKQIYNVIHGYSYAEYRKAIGESSRDLGARRKEELQRLNYSPRNASHCIRLLYAGKEALLEGYFPVRLPEVQQKICMEVKLGQITLEEFQYLFKCYEQDLDEANRDSILPEKFDYDWLDNQLVQIQKQILHKNNLL